MRNAEKTVVVIVAGFVKNEVFEVADRLLNDAECGFNRHVQPIDCEGAMVHVVSNHPILDVMDLVDASMNDDGTIDWVETETGCIPADGIARFVGRNRGGEWWTAGTVQGYSEDGSEKYEF